MGLTDFEVGIITTLSPISAMIGAPIWGALADQNPGQRKTLMIGKLIEPDLLIFLSYC